MPLRDYHCPACRAELVDVIEDADAPARACGCGAPMRRRVGRVAVRVASSVPRGTSERADWGRYSAADMSDRATATEAAYEVARQSGLSADRAASSAAVAGEAMQSAGETLIENQRKHALELRAEGKL